MARRQPSDAPRVPRSNPVDQRIGQRTPIGSHGDATVAERAVRRGPREITPLEMHAYTKRDLMRIALFGGLILAVMIALKLIGL
ncbi:MAG: hypothetical protein KDD73_15755 [Anaerolineales bacterium]|nr:hypothetical protein [Anaerolineales bacterium]MCB9127966.1 hypothetical protein [Ardenticatenales bacterium]